MNHYCGLTPVVNDKIGRACETYTKFGVKLDAATLGSPEAEEMMESNFVAVMPFHEVNFESAVALSRKFRKSVYSAVATGWAASTRFPVDVAFPLSDHADFKDILNYVEAARPKRIYCCHGNEARLSRELSKRGFCALPAGDSEVQLNLNLTGW
ncbi:Uncharacterised protein [uncultured archaeon]|nr:Uncharacterised protein [uncultured archaeon]